MMFAGVMGLDKGGGFRAQQSSGCLVQQLLQMVLTIGAAYRDCFQGHFAKQGRSLRRLLPNK
jgi:hypothetical protein